MIRIAITAEAYAAIAETLPLGSVGVEPEADQGAPGTDQGQRHIWLDPHVVNKLKYLRGPGESYSDVILRLAAGER